VCVIKQYTGLVRRTVIIIPGRKVRVAHVIWQMFSSARSEALCGRNSVKSLRYFNVKHRSGSRNLRKGADPSLPLSFPLEVRSLLNELERLGELCKIPQWGSGHSPGQKRIWCTLKL